MTVLVRKHPGNISGKNTTELKSIKNFNPSCSRKADCIEETISARGVSPGLLDRTAANGLRYLQFSSLIETGVVDHFFSTRIGGVSTGCYAQTNFSFSLGDDPEAVKENYRRAAEVLGYGRTLEPFVLSAQTHTTNLRVVTEKDRGKGTVCERDYKDIDGLVTNVPGLILVTSHADCPVLFFVDPVHRAIGLSHSGWRGTVGAIGQKTVKLMHSQYGTRPEDLRCAIGPSICKDCYEVSSDVAEAFEQAFGRQKLEQYDVLTAKEGGKYQLGLWEANRMILEDAGVPADRIEVTDVCTRCNPEVLFSHRITGFKRGNLSAFLVLRE